MRRDFLINIQLHIWYKKLRIMYKKTHTFCTLFILSRSILFCRRWASDNYWSRRGFRLLQRLHLRTLKILLVKNRGIVVKNRGNIG